MSIISVNISRTFTFSHTGDDNEDIKIAKHKFEEELQKMGSSGNGYCFNNFDIKHQGLAPSFRVKKKEVYLSKRGFFSEHQVLKNFTEAEFERKYGPLDYKTNPNIFIKVDKGNSDGIEEGIYLKYEFEKEYNRIWSENKEILKNT